MCTCRFPADSGDRTLVFTLAWHVFPSPHPRFKFIKVQMLSDRMHLWRLLQSWTKILMTQRLCFLTFKRLLWLGEYMHCYSHTESVVNESCDYCGYVIMKESTTMMTENPNRTAHQNSNTANTKQNLPVTLFHVSLLMQMAHVCQGLGTKRVEDSSWC